MVERCTSCADAYLAAAEEPVCVEVIRKCVDLWPRSLLDVGRGTSGAGARIAAALGIPYTGIDLTTGSPVEDYAGPACDVVLLKRVLCQAQRAGRLGDVCAAAARLVTPGGLLVACEPWKSHSPPGLLESTTSCSVPVPFPSVFRADWRLVADVPVAADYVVWTRVNFRCTLAYDDPQRYRFPPQEDHQYALYRVRAYLRRIPLARRRARW